MRGNNMNKELDKFLFFLFYNYLITNKNYDFDVLYIDTKLCKDLNISPLELKAIISSYVYHLLEYSKNCYQYNNIPQFDLNRYFNMNNFTIDPFIITRVISRNEKKKDITIQEVIEIIKFGLLKSVRQNSEIETTYDLFVPYKTNNQIKLQIEHKTNHIKTS